jgi:hypothetical protein
MSAAMPFLAAESAAARIAVDRSLLSRAKSNDTRAIVTMFQQFLSQDEEIHSVEYMGVEGLWGLGNHCFACVSDRRLAVLQVGLFGKVNYQDGYLEYHNSGLIYQPSKLGFYVTMVVAALAALSVGISLFVLGMLVADNVGGILGMLTAVVAGVLMFSAATLVFVLIGKAYYRFVKSGLVWVIREGVSVYVFTNRSKLTRANHLYRICTQLRDERLKAMGHP